VTYFFLPPPLDVILDVDIKSPMYFCRNLLLLSSLSCSSLTASIRLKISSSDFCRTLACLGWWLAVLSTMSIYGDNANSLIQMCSSILTHFLQILTAASWTHRPGIIFVERLVTFLQLDAWMFPGYYDGPAGLSGSKAGTLKVPTAGVVAVYAGCGRGGCGCIYGGVGLWGEDRNGTVWWRCSHGCGVLSLLYKLCVLWNINAQSCFTLLSVVLCSRKSFHYKVWMIVAWLLKMRRCVREFFPRRLKALDSVWVVWYCPQSSPLKCKRDTAVDKALGLV